MRNQSDKNKFLEKLSTHPVVSVVCRNTGISKATVWIEKDVTFKEKFDKAMTQGRESINDVAESVLLSLVKDKNIRAVEYWLTNNHDRYYRPKKAIAVDTRYGGIVSINYTVVDMPPEKVDQKLFKK